MPTIEEFIDSHGITADVEPTDSNPHIADPSWKANHWIVTLRVGEETMSVPFSQGLAIEEEPSAADVLDALASDISYLDSGEELPGAVARTIIEQGDRLADLLSEPAVDDLVHNVDRL